VIAIDGIGPVQVQVATDDQRRVAAYMEAMFDEHEGRIHGMALAATRDPDAAADITQDAFIRLLREAQAGRYPDNAGAWLYRTASNLAISRARRVAVARRFAPRLVRSEETQGPEPIALEHERSRAMRDLLARLQPVERTALVMAAQGLSGEEIAAHLGRSHGATRTLLSRARRRLRAAMDEWEAAR
jgi:RNA polymerase sigma-70 factor (ECF subfamily)